jgi:hypothetical protein
MFNIYFQALLEALLKKYNEHVPLLLEKDIPFTGTASEQTTTVFDPVDYDVILVGFSVNFSNSNVLARISDTAKQYFFSQNYCPITSLAGVSSQVSPVLVLPAPYLLDRQSRLQIEWQNSAASASASTSKVVGHGIRVRNV